MSDAEQVGVRELKAHLSAYLERVKKGATITITDRGDGHGPPGCRQAMTVSYFDTSAVVPLLIVESSTNACRQVWARSERRLSSVVVKAAVAAAIGTAHRMGRIDHDVRDSALRAASRLWRACDFISVTDTLAESAAGLAVTHGLRGYDAVHVATSLVVADDVVGVSGDATVVATWRALGLPTVDTANAPPQAEEDGLA